ncbi:ABC transporter permease [Microvirga sp. ACRRW]|uniref:ABC transporter permease n=1 Tax=Microvirga sp. ACRRW TaxID=2918205 RepID=UPI001EF5CAA8|nr:ABC transporter permease [Microvirga sp. ACRRW]MCG7392457.1 ABC transporter permease [Microvirga sp. ACRRW]
MPANITMDASKPDGFPDLLKDALEDIWDGARRYHLWLAFATEDILDAYRHTSIGILWNAFSFLLFALAIILVFGLDGQGPTDGYVVHLVTGLLIWNFINLIINQAPTVFGQNERFIKGSKLPLSIFCFQVTARALILSAFSALAALFVLVWYGYPHSWAALGAIPAIIWFIITAVPVQLLLGSLGAFTRDVQQIIENVMRAVFFLTPVMWVAVPESHRYAVAKLNPFTYYIEIFRIPIVDGFIPWNAWLACILMTGVFWAAALVVFTYTRRKIVFWI